MKETFDLITSDFQLFIQAYTVERYEHPTGGAHLIVQMPHSMELSGQYVYMRTKLHITKCGFILSRDEYGKLNGCIHLLPYTSIPRINFPEEERDV